MLILRTYLAGLGLAHLAWFYFFTTGYLLRCRTADDEACSLADLVITSVAGMAVAGFALVFLGFAHLLNLFGISAVLVLEGYLFWRLSCGNWLSVGFWRNMLRRMASGWSLPAIFLYILLLPLALPAVLPPTAVDSTSYHLAYALEWANAGRIHVDPFLRFPYYANNFLLLYSALFILKLGDYCQFLNWLCGLLSCLGVLAFFTNDAQPVARDPFWKRLQPQQFLMPLCVVLSPVFLRYLNVAIVDVPIGLFVLAPILCAYRSSADKGYERELVASGAFCVGMKLTLIGHLPLFLGSLFFATARRLRGSKIALLALAMLGLSLPWYIRNLIETHDPFPPILNSYFHRADPIFDRIDSGIYTIDTLTPRDPISLLLLPWRFVSNPGSRDFRELGASALILLLYAPILVLIGKACCRAHWPRPRFTYLSIAVLCLICPWLFSSLGRYSLHWYLVLVAWTGVLVTAGYLWLERRCHSGGAMWATWFGTAVISCLLVFPTPTANCLRFFGRYYSAAITEALSRGEKAYTAKHVHGYFESRAIIQTLTSNHQERRRVLVFGGETPAFYFRRAKIKSVGDYFGPARWGELITEINRGDCRPYLERLHIAAIIIDPRIATHSSLLYARFQRELQQYDFVEYRYGHDPIPVFVKGDMAPSHGLIRIMPNGRPPKPRPHAEQIFDSRRVS